MHPKKKSTRNINDYQQYFKTKAITRPLKGHIRKILLIILVGFICSSIALCALFRLIPPPTSAFMLYRHIEDFAKDRSFKSIQYQWVSKDEISRYAYQAVLASEDQRFFDHAGFDVKAIESAVDNYIDGKSLRGASTLSQQVAKNLFLTPSKSFIRKGLEVWLTLLCELLLGKERILLIYLNIAEFGDHLFGIEAASQHYFGISALKINREQAALLAATLPNPLILKALHPSSAVISRQQWILRQMRYIQH